MVDFKIKDCKKQVFESESVGFDGRITFAPEEWKEAAV